MYSSGEPCPMCMGAIYWSKISKVYFSNTETQALDYGFWDKEILDELKKPKNKRKIKSVHIQNATAIKLFEKAIKIR
jgi:guanine deaminase